MGSSHALHLRPFFVPVVAALCLLLAGCGWLPRDPDGDGYAAEQGDCDNADPAVYPGAQEHCDGKDEDCDGRADVASDGAAPIDAGTWYRDADQDGYGVSDLSSAGATEAACAQPSGYVDNGLDCDDTRATVHPDALEDCADAIDNNCNGWADGRPVDATSRQGDAMAGTGASFWTQFHRIALSSLLIVGITAEDPDGCTGGGDDDATSPPDSSPPPESPTPAKTPEPGESPTAPSTHGPEGSPTAVPSPEPGASPTPGNETPTSAPGPGGRDPGMIVCWGDTGDGQCNIPAPNAGWSLVSGGQFHTVGQRDDGTLLCWGFELDGACDITTLDGGYVALDVGYAHGSGLYTDGSVDGFGAAMPTPSPNANFISIDAGINFTLAVRTDGVIAGFGENYAGQAVPPEPNEDFIAAAGGSLFGLGLKSDGSIVSWGTCGAQCVPPEPNIGYTAIAAGYSHSCAIREDTSVVCFGANDSGQLDVPEPNTGFKMISLGNFFSVGLKEDGSIVGWGDNSVGQLDVPGPNSGFVYISAGGYHVVALTGDDCQNDGDCADGIYCNGTETCDGGSCEPGEPPCTEPSLCRESDDQCVSCLFDDACDDGIYCNGVEICGPAGTCQDAPDPCQDMGCDETLNYCADGGPEVWMTFSDHAFIPDLDAWAYRRDIVARNVTTGNWSLILDGADLYWDLYIIDGMARLPDGSILVSFTETSTVYYMTGGPDGTTVEDEDIVRFIPSSLGENTAGALEFYFDGSDVGLTTSDEDVDAIAVTATGELLISTLGPVSANGASGGDADLLLFTPTSLGANTAGAFSIYFDGSDVKLSDGSEDVDAADVRGDGKILLSTLNSFTVTGASGADEDILLFTPAQLGTTTTGTFSVLLDLSTEGIDPTADLGAIDYRE